MIIVFEVTWVLWLVVFILCCLMCLDVHFIQSQVHRLQFVIFLLDYDAESTDFIVSFFLDFLTFFFNLGTFFFELGLKCNFLLLLKFNFFLKRHTLTPTQSLRFFCDSIKFLRINFDWWLHVLNLFLN